MKKYIITLLTLLMVATAGIAQNNKADTIVLSLYNNGTRYMLTLADFGLTALTQNILGEMVAAYDTVITLKDKTKIDTAKNKDPRYDITRVCNKPLGDLTGKIVIMDLNKDCDVTMMCMNVQRAGAKAFVITHNSNVRGTITLPKQGIYKDSIRIPVFTVRRALGEQLGSMLPSVVGISMRLATIPPQNLATNNTLLDINTPTTPNKTTGAEPVNSSGDKVNTNESFNLGKVDPITGKFEEDVTLYPNPTTDVLNLTFKGYTGQAVDIVIFDMQGKAILTEHLGQLQRNLHSIFIGDKTVAGQYMIRIRTKGKVDVFKTFIVGK